MKLEEILVYPIFFAHQDTYTERILLCYIRIEGVDPTHHANYGYFYSVSIVKLIGC